MSVEAMIFAIGAGLFGLIVGSFLNVLVLRWQTGMTMGGRSKCFSCDKQLRWYELIPLFSYLALRGRCSKCHSKISLQYPVVELLAGIMAFGIVLVHGLSPVSIILLISAWTFLALSVYDLQHMILPDGWTYLIGTLGIIGQFSGWLPLVSTTTPYLDSLAGFIFAAPFFILWLISKGRLMGFGDIKLMIAIGFLLGWTMGLSSLLVAFWIGAIVSLGWIAFGKIMHKKSISMKQQLPFGPFLAFGAVLSMIIPVSILELIL